MNNVIACWVYAPQWKKKANNEVKQGATLSSSQTTAQQQQVVTFAHASSLLGSTSCREIVMAESRSEALSREIFLHTQSATDMSYRLDTLAKPY